MTDITPDDVRTARHKIAAIEPDVRAIAASLPGPERKQVTRLGEALLRELASRPTRLLSAALSMTADELGDAYPPAAIGLLTAVLLTTCPHLYHDGEPAATRPLRRRILTQQLGDERN